LVENQYPLIAYEMFMNWDLPATRRRLDSAFARYPNDAELDNILAAWHRWNGQLDEAVAMKRRALSIDPTSLFYAEQVAWNLYLSHRCAEAADRYRTEALAYDAAASAYYALYRAQRCQGRDADAIDALERSLRLSRDADSALFLAARTPAEREKARRVLFRTRLDGKLRARRQSWLPANDIALGFAELRDADATMAWLDSMYAEHSWGLQTVPFDPAFDFLRGDPRFMKFVRALPWHPSLAFATARPAPR
jgi:tetratricopeptide (TPR) repeat protein